MPLFEFPELIITQIVLLIGSGIWMLRRNDEIPIFVSILLFYVASYRYWAVTSGINNWVNVSNYALEPITSESALEPLAYIVFGQIIFLMTYMSVQKRVIPIYRGGEKYLKSFLTWLRPKVIWFGLFCLPLVVLTRSNVAAQVRGGRSLAFEVSGYLYQFPFVLIGVATLVLCLWRLGGMPFLWHKITATLILFGVINLTFATSGRFQFLGWIATAAIIVSSPYKPKTRLTILALCGLLGISIFAMAGAMRGAVADDALRDAAWERFFSAEDANMLDGFVLLKSAFPQIVDFRFGMAHLEILMRPIPRAIWPDKPVGGGFLAAVGLVDANTGATLGFSPTIFGDFYSEGGILGIFIFSIIYGFVIARIVRYSLQFQPFASILIRAIVIASLVPLLRGGDLPGIYAWVGMAFWPCFLLLWVKWKYLRPKLLASFNLCYPPEISHLEQRKK